MDEPSIKDQAVQFVGQIVDVMEQNARGVQIGCYSIALTTLTVAIRRVRPFSVFRKPTDIPKHFITEKKELVGYVRRIDPSGALMVEHKPLVPLPLIPQGQLPVKISGVNVSGLGVCWLQSIVAGNEVKLVPISRDKNFVQCQVFLSQLTPNKKKQRVVNVGEALVKIGFGEMVPLEKATIEDRSILSYYKKLKAAEAYAMKRKLGYKYYIKPTKAALAIALEKFRYFYYLVTKRFPKYRESKDWR